MVNSNGLVARAEQVTRAIREANYFPKESVIEGLGLDAIVVLNGRKILRLFTIGALKTDGAKVLLLREMMFLGITALKIVVISR